MEQNNQNTSTKNGKIQILISSAKSPFYTLFTISQKELDRLGIVDPQVPGVYVCSEDKPSTPHFVWNYHCQEDLERQIGQILSASIVNNDQRKAVSGLIHQAIYRLQTDRNNLLLQDIKEVETKATLAEGSDGIRIKQY